MFMYVWHHQHSKLVRICSFYVELFALIWTISLCIFIDLAHPIITHADYCRCIVVFIYFFSLHFHSHFFLFGSKCFSTNILTVEITFIIYHHMKLIIVVVVAFFHSCTNHTSRIFIFRFVEIATSIANNALKHCRSSHGNSTINIIYGTFWKLFFIFVGQTVVLWIFSSNL